MIQIAVVSGKGGTGKTVVSGGLAALLPGKKVLVDADVDAANLALILDHVRVSEEPFFGLPVAVIEHIKCILCGLCKERCRFDAIYGDETGYMVDPVRCEGCAVCTVVCQVDAVCMVKRQCGLIQRSDTPYGPLVHAHLFPGSGNSGLLVHKVRKIALSEDLGADWVIIDGPPGIGCPLISTVTGVSLALMVTEPSRSGFHDLSRLLTVCRSFKIPAFLVINRSDSNPDIKSEIIKWAEFEDIQVIGEIPYDPLVIKTVIEGKTITITNGPASVVLREIAQFLIQWRRGS